MKKFVRAEFDEVEFRAQFETENGPEIVVVDEPEAEIDNDFDLPYKAPVRDDE